MPVNLTTNVLRSFVAIVDAGSMLQAAIGSGHVARPIRIGNADPIGRQP